MQSLFETRMPGSGPVPDASNVVSEASFALVCGRMARHETASDPWKRRWTPVIEQVALWLRLAQIFKEIGGETWSSMSALRQCIGDPDSDAPSDIMDAEMAGQRGSASVRDACRVP